MRKLLLLSSSTVHGSAWLEYCREYIQEFFMKYGVKEIVFVPYAHAPFDKYTEKVRTEFTSWGQGFTVVGLNEVSDPIETVERAQGIFIGGGNTFLLLKTLQEKKLVEPIKHRVLEGDGIPYMGISAGTNVATCAINTTNDMPIVLPETLKSLGLVDFHINPHYLDTDPESTHKGETREMRLNEYHSLPESLPPVLGLREGAYLHVEGDVATLGGLKPSRLFVQGKEPVEYPSGSDVSFLLRSTD